MGLKDVDFDAIFRKLAERRIEEAMSEGKFDNLPGAGRPIELEPIPAEENARLRWWALKILRNNDVIPDEVAWRKQVESLKSELAGVRDESRLIMLVGRINLLVRKINTLGTNALKSSIAGVDLEVERDRLRLRLMQSTTTP